MFILKGSLKKLGSELAQEKRAHNDTKKKISTGKKTERNKAIKESGNHKFFEKSRIASSVEESTKEDGTPHKKTKTQAISSQPQPRLVQIFQIVVELCVLLHH